MTNDDYQPVTESLPGFRWDSEEAVAYEAAIEAINGAVGAYSALIEDEEAKGAPDQARLASLLAAQGRCARARETLDPADHARVAETRRRFAELARQVSEGHDR